VLADGVYALLGRSGVPAWLVSHAVASGLAIGVLTYFHIVIGEMVPKSLALQYAERMARWVTPVMLWTKNIFYPLVVSLNGLGNLALKVIRVDRQTQTADQYYTPEELQLIVEESEEQGVLRGDAGRMLQELFEFGDLTAGQVMVPRVRVLGIELGTTAEEIRAMLGESAHTRYPVFEEDLDHIHGMVHIKDLLRLLTANETLRATHARPMPLIPETAPLDTVLATMRRERTQMAVVIDEHGGTSGIVTLEDLFEEVVGEIDDSPSQPQMYRDAAGRLRVPGTLRVDELGQQFDLELEHEDVDSVSGLILTLLGRPAQVGDTVRYERLEFVVTAVKGHGVEECAVSLV
jgi:CBS domain containing-hemolysin-like protein